MDCGTVSLESEIYTHHAATTTNSARSDPHDCLPQNYERLRPTNAELELTCYVCSRPQSPYSQSSVAAASAVYVYPRADACDKIPQVRMREGNTLMRKKKLIRVALQKLSKVYTYIYND